jgi:hypothetical protein
VDIVSVRLPGIEFMEELGRGASSVVYRARRGTVPGAVKFPIPGVEAKRERAYRSVRREAAALARLSNPSLPRGMEVGSV